MADVSYEDYEFGPSTPKRWRRRYPLADATNGTGTRRRGCGAKGDGVDGEGTDFLKVRRGENLQVPDTYQRRLDRVKPVEYK